jgi:CRP/FNR family transcriptional regulator, cyclic AMP receptor protein
MRVERLRAVPLFAGCNDQELRFIALRVDEVDISAGQTICRKGGNAGNFFIILTGKAEVDAPQGKHTLAAGDFFGEIALLDNGPRTATVRAATALRCYVLGPAQFQEVLHQSVDIAVKMLHVVTHRLREASPLPTG